MIDLMKKLDNVCCKQEMLKIEFPGHMVWLCRKCHRLISLVDEQLDDDEFDVYIENYVEEGI